MQLSPKVLGTVSALGLGTTATVALADYSTSTIATDVGNVSNGITQTVIGIIVTFLTNNLPLIFAVIVSFSLLFALAYMIMNAWKRRK